MSIKNKIPENISRRVKNAFLALRGIYFVGTKFHCPLCEGDFRKMLPGGFDLDIIKKKEIIGAGYRKNNICPACQSTDRDRLIFVYLNNSGFFNKKQKVLHISPEPSLYKVISKHPEIKYITGTKYSEGIYYPQKIMKLDLVGLPFQDNEFDFIMCNHVLEHIEDDQTAMKELYRVLKPGGSGILQVPISLTMETTFEDPEIISKSNREKYYGQFDHVRIYGKDYSERLQKVGFIVEHFNPEENDKIQFALNPKENLFVVKKNQNNASKGN